VQLLSLHQLPANQERRPCVTQGLEYEQHLTGSEHPPVCGAVSSPKITLELHTIGGFCCVSHVLPADDGVTRSASTEQVDGNGFNARFGGTFHCLAAEPNETILHLAVWDRGEMVAYETAVLGTLRSGYRSLQLRDMLGTKIELCFVAVHVDLGTEPHLYAAKRELNDRIVQQQRTIEEQREELRELRALLPTRGEEAEVAAALSVEGSFERPEKPLGMVQQDSSCQGVSAGNPRETAVRWLDGEESEGAALKI
jgi:hypothetical protein